MLLPLLLAAALAQAPLSSPVSSSTEELPPVVQLATQKVSLPAAQIPLSTLEGKDIRLGDFDAKVVVVVLWSTIIPEQQQLAHLESLCRGYRGQKKQEVACLAINIDRPRGPEDLELLRQVRQEQGANYPFLVDKELKLLALVNERYRPAGMERNRVLLPGFLLFTRKFQSMEQAEVPRGGTDEAVEAALRAAVEKARRGR